MTLTSNPKETAADVGFFDRLLRSLDSVVRERFTPPATIYLEWSANSSRNGVEYDETSAFELDPENWIRIELEGGPEHKTIYREFDLTAARNVWIVDHDGESQLLYSESDESLADWRRENQSQSNHV